ncbi:MAG: LysE family translocator [Pseudomonadota bacterium]
MALDLWLAFALASAVVLMIPGPTILLVCSYAVSAGRSVGLWVVLGVGLGDLVAMSLAILGLGALLQSSALVFEILRWVGAAYLVYLGYKLWTAPASLESTEAASPAVSGPVMALHSFVVTVTNPKSILFFIAFVPQFFDPALPALGQGMVMVMVATFVGMAMANALVYVWLAAGLRHRLTRPGSLRLVNRIGGGALVGLGVAAAAASRP